MSKANNLIEFLLIQLVWGASFAYLEMPLWAIFLPTLIPTLFFLALTILIFFAIILGALTGEFET
jgi:hypothetical protein